MKIKGLWWKAITVLLLMFILVGGLLFDVPRLIILNETVRNLYFHVPMWFTMIVLQATSIYYSIKFYK